MQKEDLNRKQKGPNKIDTHTNIYIYMIWYPPKTYLFTFSTGIYTVFVTFCKALRVYFKKVGRPVGPIFTVF